MKDVFPFRRNASARVVALVAITIMVAAGPTTSYAPENARDLAVDSTTKITFLDYDWSLNEARGD